MTLLLLHGEAGGWDELVIALVAFGVLWVAVKLAGRKSAGPDDEAALDELAGDALVAEEEHKDPAHPPATPLG
jgi:hypothetical protein